MCVCRETARELVQKGWHVVLACRNLEQAESAASSIRATAQLAQLATSDSATREGPGGSVEVGPRLDLADPESIAAFVTSFQKAHPVVDVLVNNAGA